MIIQLATRLLITIVVISVVIFLLTHLFTDPVGSAHAISSLLGWIWDKIEALWTFGSSFSS